MNEEQWLSSTNLYEMLQYLKANHNAHRRKAGRRKLRLYSCACARRIWDRLNEECRALVETVELMLDGHLTEADVQTCLAAAHTRYHVDLQVPTPQISYSVLGTVAGNRYLDNKAMGAASAVTSLQMAEQHIAGVTPPDLGAALFQRIFQSEAPRQTALLREIFGNPFRPWPMRKFPAEVRGLAEACVEDHTHYPVLADALEDLGENVAAAHCREPGHVRGCHVVDWILGRA